MIPSLGIAHMFRPAWRIHEDPDCRSTKEFREEMVAEKRTFHERFVDGPVWAPKPELKPPRLVTLGIPVSYKLNLPGQPLTIIAHPEIAAEMRRMLASRHGNGGEQSPEGNTR